MAAKKKLQRALNRNPSSLQDPKSQIKNEDETTEERERRLQAERKHKARRKALAEDHLQNERLRERERRKSPLQLVNHNLGGSLRLEGRHFPEKKQAANSIDNNIALLGEFELNLNYKNLEVKIWNLGRYDFVDKDRSQILPYENWIAHKTKHTIFKAGMQIENWSMTEVFHPSDVFNSRNMDSDLENTEKIGEPALSLRVDSLGGFATFFYMPVFWSPLFPSTDSRLSALPSGGKLLNSIFLNNGALNENDSLVNQYAFRYSRKFGNADVGFHYLNSIDRQEPLMTLDIPSGGFRPLFLPVKQIGLNSSIIGNEIIYKFDVVHRSFSESLLDPGLGRIYQPDHNIVALGLERSWSFQTGTELTLYSEWQKILQTSTAEARSLSLFQNDLMLGARFAFNDLNSKELKAYLIDDLNEKSEMLWTVSYNQKLSMNLKVSGGYRSVAGRKGATQELNDADHFFINLTYFFER